MCDHHRKQFPLYICSVAEMKMTINSVGEGIKEVEFSDPAGGPIKWHSYLGKQLSSFLKS